MSEIITVRSVGGKNNGWKTISESFPFTILSWVFPHSNTSLNLKRCNSTPIRRTYPVLSSGGHDCILEPLCFPEELNARVNVSTSDDRPVFCVLCSHTAPLMDKDRLLKHLLLEHKLVIADIKLIADFPKYDRKQFCFVFFSLVTFYKLKVEVIRGYGYECFSELCESWPGGATLQLLLISCGFYSNVTE